MTHPELSGIGLSYLLSIRGAVISVSIVVTFTAVQIVAPPTIMMDPVMMVEVRAADDGADDAADNRARRSGDERARARADDGAGNRTGQCGRRSAAQSAGRGKEDDNSFHGGSTFVRREVGPCGDAHRALRHR